MAAAQAFFVRQIGDRHRARPGDDGRTRQLPSSNSGPNSAKACASGPITISTIGLNRIIAASRVDISLCAASRIAVRCAVLSKLRRTAKLPPLPFKSKPTCSRESPPTAHPVSFPHGDQHFAGRMKKRPIPHIQLYLLARTLTEPVRTAFAWLRLDPTVTTSFVIHDRPERAPDITPI